jgi:hypothetical protein
MAVCGHFPGFLTKFVPDEIVTKCVSLHFARRTAGGGPISLPAKLGPGTA